MWRWGLGVVLAVAVLVAMGAVPIYLVVTGFFDVVESIGSKGEAKSITLKKHLDTAKPEAVALLVGDEWSLITDIAVAQEKRFSYWEDGFLRVMTGRGECQKSAPRIAIEPLVAGVLSKPIYTCKRGGTDIKALLALAQPAQEVSSADLTLADWRDLHREVVADPTMFPANKRAEVELFDYSCDYEFPIVWEDQSGDISRRYEAGIRALLEPVLGRESDHDLRLEYGYTSYVARAAQGRSTSEEGWAIGTPFSIITRGDEQRMVPGVALYHPAVFLQGSKTACEALAGLDFSGLWQNDRDMAQLERAWSDGIAIEVGMLQNWDDVIGSTPVVTPAIQKRFGYRYFKLE